MSSVLSRSQSRVLNMSLFIQPAAGQVQPSMLSHLQYLSWSTCSRWPVRIWTLVSQTDHTSKLLPFIEYVAIQSTA